MANGSRTLSNERGMTLSEVERQLLLGLNFKMVSISELGVSPETVYHSFCRNNPSKLTIKGVFIECLGAEDNDVAQHQTPPVASSQHASRSHKNQILGIDSVYLNQFSRTLALVDSRRAVLRSNYL